MKSSHPQSISVVVPIYNEAKTVQALHERLLRVLRSMGMSFEIIFVDDGSSDGTFESMRHLQSLTAIRLRRNYGQSQALNVGIQKAKGEVIVLMDSDLENHPEDIPMLIAKIEEGFDVVSGWRKDRWQGKWLTRKLPSQIANWLISRVSGVSLHDYGCTLKAYRREIFQQLVLQGEGHRLLAAYAGIEGAQIAEVPVRYTPRQFGNSNYGLVRTFKVLGDIFALLFFQRYAKRPMHFFGALAFLNFILSGVVFAVMAYLRIMLNISFILTPLPILVVFFAMIGIQFLLMGVLAELIVRRGERPEEILLCVKEEKINS